LSLLPVPEQRRPPACPFFLCVFSMCVYVCVDSISGGEEETFERQS
jgi:hypothetical protein